MEGGFLFELRILCAEQKFSNTKGIIQIIATKETLEAASPTTKNILTFLLNKIFVFRFPFTKKVLESIGTGGVHTVCQQLDPGSWRHPYNE